MRTFSSTLLFTLVLAVPAGLWAQSTGSGGAVSSQSSSADARFDFATIDLDRYTDAPWDHPTNIAVSVLTEEGVLQGNPDGTFRPGRILNRAEFLQIVLRLLPSGSPPASLTCFPDVPADVWFAPAVCRAKEMGIVRGNGREGVPPDQWLFEPERAVQYEEALKMLSFIFALPVTEGQGETWYIPFLEEAKERDLALHGLVPGHRLTRGEMARLTLGFLAESAGQLPDLRAAEEAGSSSVSSFSRRSESSIRSSARSSAASRSSAPRDVGQFDPYGDALVRSHILLLGQVTPSLGGVEFFSNNEPVRATAVTVTLASPAPSVASLLLFDENRRPLGTASAISATEYRVLIPDGRFTLPYRESISLYFRGRLLWSEEGGVSGETVQVASVALEGTGEWTSDARTVTLTDDFVASQTARAVIMAVENAGSAEAALASGTQQLLGAFRFTAQTPDARADARLEEIVFAVEQSGVVLQNVELRRAESNERISCILASSRITCSDLPVALGTVEDELMLRVYGDVSLTPGAVNPLLRLAINVPGTTASAGDVTWTDGTTLFTWLPFDPPVVRGTLLR